MEISNADGAFAPRRKTHAGLLTPDQVRPFVEPSCMAQGTTLAHRSVLSWRDAKGSATETMPLTDGHAFFKLLQNRAMLAQCCSVFLKALFIEGVCFHEGPVDLGIRSRPLFRTRFLACSRSTWSRLHHPRALPSGAFRFTQTTLGFASSTKDQTATVPPTQRWQRFGPCSRTSSVADSCLSNSLVWPGPKHPCPPALRSSAH